MLSSSRLYLLGSIAVVQGYYGECFTGDKYCQRVNKDPGSYCKFELYEPVCHGGDQPCSCTKEEDCSYGDEFCQYVNDDATSRCDQRTSPPTCRGYRGGGQVCECSPTQCPTGDTYCQDINYDESSYCKYWLDIAVCQGGDQRCSCDEQQCASGDQFCRDFSGNPYSSCEPSRYGDHSFCSGTYQKCDCTGNKMCPLGNERCEKYVGYDSFCQYWDKYPTCSGSKVPCGCEEEKCPSGDQFCKYTTKNPYSMCESEDGRGGRCSGSYGKCDCTGDKVCSYGNERCESEVGYDSYCQYWEKYPTCSGSKGRVSCQCEPDKCASGDAFCEYTTGNPYSSCAADRYGERCTGTKGKGIDCDCTGYSTCPRGNNQCEKYVGYGSYCQYWDEYSLCSGSETPCFCNPRRDCLVGDTFCQEVNDDEYDYCDVRGYGGEGTCAKGGQLCDCTMGGSCPVGDDFCKYVNTDSSSFCKFWLEPNVCFGGNQPCACPPVSPTPTPPYTTPYPYGCEQADYLCDELMNFEGAFCNKEYGRCALGNAVSPFPCDCSSACPRADVFCRAALDMPFTPQVQYNPYLSACTFKGKVIVEDVLCVPDTSDVEANSYCGVDGNCQFGFQRYSDDVGFCLRTAAQCPPPPTPPPTTVDPQED